MRQFMFKAGVAAFALFLSLSLAEIGLRVTRHDSLFLMTDRYMTSRARPVPHVPRFTAPYIRLKEWPPNHREWDTPADYQMAMADSLVKKPYLIETDARGFLGPFVDVPSPEVTIMFFGGSTTECRHVDPELRFPFLVGELLREETGRPVQTINAGSYGSHIMNLNLKLMARGIDAKPTIAVLMENINDLATLLGCATYWNDHPQRSLVVDREASADAMEEWQHYRARSTVWDEDAAAEMYGRAIETFIGICLANRIEPVLMTQFNRFADDAPEVVRRCGRDGYVNVDYATFQRAYVRFNETMRAVAARHGVRLIDLDRAVPRESRYMSDAVHLNNEGSMLVANAIAKALR